AAGWGRRPRAAGARRGQGMRAWALPDRPGLGAGLGYRWPFGPIPMGARSPAHISPTQARHGPEYYWARAGTGTIAGPCLGLNPGPWTRPSTTRNSRPDRPDGRHGGPGTAHGPLAGPGRQKSRWRRWRAAGPAQRSGRAGM